jgi:glycosyltransferase involved in cell wall biosynthesis
MRIALVSTPFVAVPPRSYGGTELVVHELAEGLSALGHEVVLFATGDSRTSGELRWKYLRPQWPPEILADLDHVSWAMREVAEDGSFDLIHAHSAVALACARLLPEIPLVYTIHHERDEQLSAFYRHCQNVHYIAISDDQRRREIPLRNVRVIHHGLDPSKYHGASTSVGDYVCFVGRFSRVKGPHTAIDAAARAGLPIRVAGEVHPPDEGWVATELRHRLEHPHVRYLGSIGMPSKAVLLCGARALLAPIEWNEPFGLVLIEAMLAGCPVVAYPRGSVPELLEHGVTGFIARSLDDLVALIRPGGAVDRFDRRRCRARAIERFGRDLMVARHTALYERVRSGFPVAPAPSAAAALA